MLGRCLLGGSRAERVCFHSRQRQRRRRSSHRTQSAACEGARLAYDRAIVRAHASRANDRTSARPLIRSVGAGRALRRRRRRLLRCRLNQSICANSRRAAQRIGFRRRRRRRSSRRLLRRLAIGCAHMAARDSPPSVWRRAARAGRLIRIAGAARKRATRSPKATLTTTEALKCQWFGPLRDLWLATHARVVVVCVVVCCRWCRSQCRCQ